MEILASTLLSTNHTDICFLLLAFFQMLKTEKSNFLFKVKKYFTNKNILIYHIACQKVHQGLGVPWHTIVFLDTSASLDCEHKKLAEYFFGNFASTVFPQLISSLEQCPSLIVSPFFTNIVHKKGKLFKFLLFWSHTK